MNRFSNDMAPEIEMLPFGPVECTRRKVDVREDRPRRGQRPEGARCRDSSPPEWCSRSSCRPRRPDTSSVTPAGTERHVQLGRFRRRSRARSSSSRQIRSTRPSPCTAPAATRGRCSRRSRWCRHLCARELWRGDRDDAPRSAPPLLSVIRPEIVPVGVCPAASVGKRNRTQTDTSVACVHDLR